MITFVPDCLKTKCVDMQLKGYFFLKSLKFKKCVIDQLILVFLYSILYRPKNE